MNNTVAIIEIVALLWVVGASLFYTFAHMLGFIKFVNPFDKNINKAKNIGFMEAMHKYKIEGTLREFAEAFTKQKTNKWIGK